VAGRDVRASKIVTSHFHLRAPLGFTMVELIVVILLIGILGAVGVTRFMDRKDTDADAFADTARSMLRYGQKVAIAQNRPVFVRLTQVDPDTGDPKKQDSIALCFDKDCTLRVPSPSGTNSGTALTQYNCDNDDSWYCEAPAQGLSYTVAPAMIAFFFDEQGRPFPRDANTAAAISAFEPADIVISGSDDGRTRKITVERDTGYVH
jgi:MSHA pilin protein MshC